MRRPCSRKTHTISSRWCAPSPAGANLSEEQIIAALAEHEAGLKTKELCRKHGISDASFYNWKARFGGMTVPETERLHTLEDENRRLKKLLAESVNET
jgi:putative transposase